MRFKRIYPKMKTSTLLLGPRGTGKSTFVKESVKPMLTLDLLKNSEFRPLKKNPSELEALTSHLKPGSFIFIDEIQKIPELLDEVHRLIENYHLNFILSGSSARKLKKQGVNLLAGRAISRKMFPLSLHEVGHHRSLEDIIFRGTLPSALNADTADDVNDFLFSYVETYLREEIFQESVIRNLEEFVHFIELSGQYHGQIVNLENISREVGKSGDTIKSWFQILQDTLVGSFLPSYSLNLFPKESKHPKYYYFDPGVARAAEGIKTLDFVSEKKGFYLETLIINELKVYREVQRADFKIFYYNIPSIGDIDLFIEIKRKTLSQPSEFITIDIKMSREWNTKYEKLANMISEKTGKRHKRAIAIYQGARRIKKGAVDVYPIYEFIKDLWAHKIL